MAALKDHVNMGFLVNGLPQKQMDLFEGKGKKMQHMQFFSLDAIDEKRIVKLF